ncbi:hypothetical protein THASP1DRAFT_22958 [Thamnocephalis sphaerospora]|uniref:Uncharacterized protein n=1 Tax=Thamnocephalis sphaerospora TaxID=78915 RepID=A0A4P9XUN6_9FUNG|nr:hypothetical protein THASP1DRAFT_22958 [Thamnocephalis sphaerospora]|eukprot:RKP09160.1 hypothetical protein THASP1DRAFT_22958 [Thamnocephalis sphaerospora]
MSAAVGTLSLPVVAAHPMSLCRLPAWGSRRMLIRRIRQWLHATGRAGCATTRQCWHHLRELLRCIWRILVKFDDHFDGDGGDDDVDTGSIYYADPEEADPNTLAHTALACGADIVPASVAHATHSWCTPTIRMTPMKGPLMLNATPYCFPA